MHFPFPCEYTFILLIIATIFTTTTTDDTFSGHCTLTVLATLTSPFEYVSSQVFQTTNNPFVPLQPTRLGTRTSLKKVRHLALWEKFVPLESTLEPILVPGHLPVLLLWHVAMHYWPFQM